MEAKVLGLEKELRRARRGVAQELASAAAMRVREQPQAQLQATQVQEQPLVEMSIRGNVGSDEIIQLLRQEVERLTGERDALALRLRKDEDKEDQRIETATADLRQRLQQLENELEDARKTIDSTHSELQAAKKRAEAADNQVKALQLESESLTKRLGQLELARVDERKSNREETDKAVKDAKEVVEAELHRLRSESFLFCARSVLVCVHMSAGILFMFMYACAYKTYSEAF